jgi:hypothetical protein
MIPLPNEIDLVRAADNHIVQARFVRLTRPVAKVKIDATWWQDLGASTEMRKKGERQQLALGEEVGRIEK